MPVSQRRGPYAKTQARRAEIARAALDVVTTDGHKAVTVASVAARSGLSEATVAYHFATRDHLLVAAVELSNEVMAEGADIDLLAAHLRRAYDGQPMSDVLQLTCWRASRARASSSR